MSMLTENKRRLALASQRGMTLVEIMIVLAILSLIMTAVGFTGFAQLEKARVKDTRIVMHNVEQAMVQWQTESSEPCPGSLDDLVAKKLLPKTPKDGWNRPFGFKCPGDHNNDIDLWSKGKDGKEGTDDDIRNWEDENAEKKK